MRIRDLPNNHGLERQKIPRRRNLILNLVCINWGSKNKCLGTLPSNSQFPTTTSSLQQTLKFLHSPSRFDTDTDPNHRIQLNNHRLLRQKMNLLVPKNLSRYCYRAPLDISREYINDQVLKGVTEEKALKASIKDHPPYFVLRSSRKVVDKFMSQKSILFSSHRISFRGGFLHSDNIFDNVSMELAKVVVRAAVIDVHTEVKSTPSIRGIGRGGRTLSLIATSLECIWSCIPLLAICASETPTSKVTTCIPKPRIDPNL
ncbi:unnamed protein product [Malus baccata var. baccata]